MKKHTPTAQFAHFKHDDVMFMFHCIYKIILKDSCVWCHCRGTAGIMGTNLWQTDIFIPARVKKTEKPKLSLKAVSFNASCEISAPGSNNEGLWIKRGNVLCEDVMRKHKTSIHQTF